MKHFRDEGIPLSEVRLISVPDIRVTGNQLRAVYKICKKNAKRCGLKVNRLPKHMRRFLKSR
jgi:hypothetical protein